MKSYIFGLLFFVFAGNIATAQSYSWGKTFGGKVFDIVKSCATDIHGNIYLTGYFSDTVDFDPGTDEHLLMSGGGDDAFLLKLDADGNFRWAQRFGNNSTDVGAAVTTTTASDIYLTGTYCNSIQIGNNTLVQSGVGPATFICKIDSSGNVLWAKTLKNQSGGSINVNTVAADNAGNVYTAGYFNGTMLPNPDDNTVTLQATGAISGFISKLDASGEYVWVKPLLSDYIAEPKSIAVDDFQNVYVGGYHSGNTDFNPHPDSSVTKISNGSSFDIFILKLSEAGSYEWVRTMGGSMSDHLYGIALDDSANIYFTGVFRLSPDFSEDSSIVLTTGTVPTAYVAKLNTDGATVWAHKIAGDPVLTSGKGHAIATDDAGYVYIAGEFGGTVDFDPGIDTFNMSTVFGASDGFVLKLTQDASFVWARRIGGTNQADIAKALAVYDSDIFYVTGTFVGTTNLDPMGNGQNIAANTPSWEDIFVIKYSVSVNTSATKYSEERNNEILYYPNPAENILYVETDSEATVTISSLEGSIIKTQNTGASSTINISDIASGVYILSVQTATNMKSYRLVKM